LLALYRDYIQFYLMNDQFSWRFSSQSPIASM
jgi:hypothetical protein